MKKIFLFFIALFFVNMINAQTVADAVRFSVFDVTSTSRSVGVGGGLSALGGDFSTLSVNPAGLALYRGREFTFTPSLEFINSEAELKEGMGVQEKRKVNFNFSNLGLVLARRPTSRTWTTANFGFGFNRVANFHQKVNYEGVTRGSIVDRWLELADGSTPNQLDNFESGLAYDVGAIFPVSGSDVFYDADIFPTDNVLKSQEITRKGAINEMVFTFAGNIKERVMLGATLGVPFLRFEETKTYRESDPNSEIPFFNSLRFSETLETTGTGINLKIGAIFRIHQAFRLGLAIHTPTGFQLTDKYSTVVAYDFEPFDDGQGNIISPIESQESPELEYSYNFRTPWRFIGSAGIVIGKVGFLTGEIEYVNYPGNKYTVDAEVASPTDEEIFRLLNAKIDNELESNINFRFGGEVALQKLRFRGGLNLSGTPYADDSGLDSSLSLGAGIRWESIFLDIAYRRVMNNEVYIPYVISDFEVGGTEISQQEVNIDDNRNRFMVTMGVRF